MYLTSIGVKDSTKLIKLGTVNYTSIDATNDIYLSLENFKNTLEHFRKELLKSSPSYNPSSDRDRKNVIIMIFVLCEGSRFTAVHRAVRAIMNGTTSRRWSVYEPLLQSWEKIYTDTGNGEQRHLTNTEVKEFVRKHRVEKDSKSVKDKLWDESLVKFVEDYIGL
jgi:hypothetical protein